MMSQEVMQRILHMYWNPDYQYYYMKAKMILMYQLLVYLIIYRNLHGLACKTGSMRELKHGNHKLPQFQLDGPKYLITLTL